MAVQDAMRAIDYQELGRKAALTGIGNPPRGGWQLRAFNEGYLVGKEEKGGLKAVPKAKSHQAAMAVVLEARRKEAFAHWPSGAAEHLRRLAMELADEKNARRQQRLMNACARLSKRYGPAKQPTVDTFEAALTYLGKDSRLSEEERLPV